MSSHCADERGPYALLARCRLELHDQFGGYPAAVLYVNALGLGPLAYLGGVQHACRAPARAAGRPPGSTADSPGSIHVAVRASRSSWACLVFRSISYSVPSRPKRTVPSAALPSRSSINVDKQGLYLLGHGRSSPLTGLWRASVCSSSRTSVQPRRRPQPLAACAGRFRRAGPAARLNR